MSNKKHLGMGLDLLLRDNGNNSLESNNNRTAKESVEILDNAIKNDVEGQTFEAFYFYRQVIDLVGFDADSPAEKAVLSQACNNAAVILFEGGFAQEAVLYLQQAVDIYPQNDTARENLEMAVNATRE